jgi:hypothetical protein
MQIRQHISDWKCTIGPLSELPGAKSPPGLKSAEGSVRRFSSLVRTLGPGGSKWPEIHRRRFTLYTTAEAVKRTA